MIIDTFREMIRKAFLTAVLSSIFCAPLVAEDWVGSYDSSVIAETPEDPVVYSLETIEKLRRSVSPRYVRVLDWRSGQGKPGLVKGILFTCEALRSKDVAVAGDFSGWKPLQMKRNRNGVFFYILPIREVEEGKRILSYRYKFQSAGIWFHDPRNPARIDDGLGGYVSHFELEKEDVNRQAAFRVLREAHPGKERLVEFAVHEKALGRAAKRKSVTNVAIVGDFNGWNPDHDWLKRDEDGIYRLRLRLPPGEYPYVLIVDGKWVLDPYNPQTRKHSRLDDLVSFAIIQ